MSTNPHALLLVIVVALIGSITRSQAQVVTLHGTGGVTVTKTYGGLREIRALRKANYDFAAHPDVWQPLIACVAADGDHAVITNSACGDDLL
jgi:hypothetical protein